MYYEPILEKMIPGIFVPLNNKKIIGYTQIFIYIKDYIILLINNDIKKLKWSSFISHFEEGLYSSFKNVFDMLPDIKHNGCFFHFLKNIRKWLMKNGFTKK